ncbi:MAG: SGNH/GDSL hydrolase family protein [Gemmatimonadetes bacterium]|jgi:hypothetical protein|nr:SGNH/GDSL hydrolase family protein [Gemmatimonadota bacterium]MBT6144753.1 SGNH/GDSL hydrolase family protein [Gemmatimonadota bacterium]MBT7864327.1 SGNH/GDSL hydrolase family protein [Gemmatimonadota bacterium]
MTTLLLCLLLAMSACSDKGPTQTPGPEGPLEILFVGSSFLAYGETDVVDTLAAFAGRGGRGLSVHRRVLSGFSLARHAQNEQTLSAIDQVNWDAVVIQGSGTYLAKPEWHEDVFPHLATLTQAARSRSPAARIIYVMPWAFKDGLQWIEGETATYQQMQTTINEVAIQFADSLSISVAPVGPAWQQVMASDYEQDLFFADLSHQSVYGAYLTACVLYTTLFLEPVPATSFTGRDDLESYPPLLSVAYDTVMDDLVRWNLDE